MPLAAWQTFFFVGRGGGYTFSIIDIWGTPPPPPHTHTKPLFADPPTSTLLTPGPFTPAEGTSSFLKFKLRHGMPPPSSLYCARGPLGTIHLLNVRPRASRAADGPSLSLLGLFSPNHWSMAPESHTRGSHAETPRYVRTSHATRTRPWYSVIMSWCSNTQSKNSLFIIPQPLALFFRS